MKNWELLQFGALNRVNSNKEEKKMEYLEYGMGKVQAWIEQWMYFNMPTLQAHQNTVVC